MDDARLAELVEELIANVSLSEVVRPVDRTDQLLRELEEDEDKDKDEDFEAVILAIEERGFAEKERKEDVVAHVKAFLIRGYGVVEEDVDLIGVFGSYGYHPSTRRTVKRAEHGVSCLERKESSSFTNHEQAQKTIEEYYLAGVINYVCDDHTRLEWLVENVAPLQSYFTSCVYSLLDLVQYKLDERNSSPETPEARIAFADTFTDTNWANVQRFIRWEIQRAMSNLNIIYKMVTNRHGPLEEYLNQPPSKEE